jgi:hypothetical protein
VEQTRTEEANAPVTKHSNRTREAKAMIKLISFQPMKGISECPVEQNPMERVPSEQQADALNWENSCGEATR